MRISRFLSRDLNPRVFEYETRVVLAPLRRCSSSCNAGGVLQHDPELLWSRGPTLCARCAIIPRDFTPCRLPMVSRVA